MEVSQTIETSQHGVASPDGRHIATVNKTRLEVRSGVTLHLVRSITIIAAHNWTIRWSPVHHKSEISQRFLVADDDHVRVWDLLDEKWTTTIKNGSGGMGKMVNVDFGRTQDEVLVFSDFGSKATVWSLRTRRAVEIRDPKFPTKGHAHRSRHGTFALLSRPAAQDILTLHRPDTYELVRTTSLLTNDAQGLKWSPDGRWIAVWDTPSMGYRLHIYTADGHLYRTYSGPVDNTIEGLGVRSIDWSPRNDFVAIGGHDRRVTLLSTRTFSPIMFLDHNPEIQLADGNTVWEEQVSASQQRSYVAVSQPVAPPTASPTPLDQIPKIGISTIAFSSDGTMLATRDDKAPTTVWLWDLAQRTARAVLIQHSPVKHVAWHPTKPTLLLIQCTHEEPTVYIYNTSASTPQTITLPLLKSTGYFFARWLHIEVDKKPAFTFGDSGNFIVAWPEGKDVIVRFDAETGSQVDEGEDSLFEILTGKKSPAKRMVDSTEVLVSDLDDERTEMVDDTFMGRGKLVGTRSAMDEMF